MNWLKIAPAALGATCIVCSLAIPPALASNSPHQAQSAPEMGVSVVFSDVAPLPDNQELAQAQRVFKYISGLGANAVSLNIPFYMSSQSASTVSSGIGTPSAPVLRAIIEVARQDGLSVQLRPLLSELGDDTVTTGEWRGSIVPADPAEWFASYWTWLEPYVLVAKQTGVSSFSIGAELNTMVTATPSTATSPEAPTIGAHNFLTYWIPLEQNVQAILGDKTVYSTSHLIMDSVPGTQFGFDAYTPITLPKGASTPTMATPAATVVADFVPGITQAFKASGFAATLATTRLEEVGIAAVANAWTVPNDFTYPHGTPVARWVQADWDTAMCDVVQNDHMAGIYFWSIDFNSFSPTYDADTANAGTGDVFNFEGTSTVTAMESCFANLKSGL